jgi:tRNA(fMet)-specific endonuclease VapC
MKQYLLDTDVAVNYLRGFAEVIQRVLRVGAADIFLSEITVAELKYGAAKSKRPEHTRLRVDFFCGDFAIVPIYPALDVFAHEKARLEKLGLRLEDFDLLIGATAMYHELILVTNNTKHFERMQSLHLENWT